MKKSLDQGLNECPAGIEIDYYGESHLRLVYNGSIVGIISLSQTDLSEVKDYITSQGFKFGKEVDSSSVKSLPTGRFGWK